MFLCPWRKKYWSWWLGLPGGGDITLSDIVGVVYEETGDSPDVVTNILDEFAVINVDIYDLNEVPFSCRDVIIACTDQQNPLYEELLSVAAENSTGSASVASAEYGINDAIPHSKGGELLCPGNNISEGFIRLESLNINNEIGGFDDIVIFIGLNNGNQRGSMDSFTTINGLLNLIPFDPWLNIFRFWYKYR